MGGATIRGRKVPARRAKRLLKISRGMVKSPFESHVRSEISHEGKCITASYSYRGKKSRLTVDCGEIGILEVGLRVDSGFSNLKNHDVSTIEGNQWPGLAFNGFRIIYFTDEI